MFEAYSVGVTLKLHNLISPQLAILAKEFEKLDLATATLSKSLSKISVDTVGLRGLARSTESTGRAFERAAASAGVYEARLAAIHRTSSALGGFGRGGGGGGGGHGGSHSGRLHIGPGGIGVGAAGFALGDAFWPIAAGGAALYGGKALYESVKSLDTEQWRFRQLGLSEAQNQEAFKFMAGMHIYGSSLIENSRNFREAQGVFRESGLDGSGALAGAKLAAPILSKLNALDAALDGESAAHSAASNLAMLRFVESAGGLKSQAEFNRLANIGYKLKVGSGDTVDWEQLRQFGRRGGSSVINMTGEGLARIEPSISTLGGSTVGTALNTSYGRLSGIVKGLPVAVIDEFLKYGIWDKSKVELNKHGGIRRFLDPNGPMSESDRNLLATNPEGFYEQVVRPMFVKMNLDAAGVARQNAMIYARTGGGLANEWEKQLPAIAKAVETFKKTLSIDAATMNLPKSLTGQEEEFVKAWTDFKTQWGKEILPVYNKILDWGATALRGASDTSSVITAAKGASKLLPGGYLGDLWDLLSWTNQKAAAERYDPDNPLNPVPSGGASRFVASKGLTLTINPAAVNLDGYQLGSILFDLGAKAAGDPVTGITGFDDTMHIMPAGGGIVPY